MTNEAVVRQRSGQPQPADPVQPASQRRLDEHATRVMGYACWLARTLRLSTQQIAEIRVASLLHDIGKTALPQALLDKTTSLTQNDWRQIRKHPELGCALARALSYDERIRTLIRHHHEHWDGTGYPCGLQETDTPVGSRIIAIADVFDALTSPRSYRVALDAGAALAVMRAETGRVLDPHLFAVFEEIMEDNFGRRERVGAPNISTIAALLGRSIVH